MKKIRNRITALVTGMAIMCLFCNTIKTYATEGEEKEPKEHVILFVSDIHETVEENLKPFLTRYKETADETEYICFGGDYAKKYDKKVLNDVVSCNNSLLPQTKAVYTVGNHDLSGFEEKSFNDITKQASRGRKIKEEGYVIYTFGASTDKQSFREDDIKQLETFLETTKTIIPRVPVFIISHYPLHYCEKGKRTRVTEGAEQLITLLDQYSNVIFLYGHNHSMSDQNYEIIYMPGDEIEIAKNEYRTINFCYTSMGAMKDGAGMQVYALKVSIKNTTCCNQVSLEHLNFDSEPKDKMMVCFPLVEK